MIERKELALGKVETVFREDGSGLVIEQTPKANEKIRHGGKGKSCNFRKTERSYHSFRSWQSIRRSMTALENSVLKTLPHKVWAAKKLPVLF